MAGQNNRLVKTLTLAPAVGLAITMVVGSGLLVLPGLAYLEAGSTAIYAWIISALVSVPLLVVFARFGATFPGAGGIAGFVQQTFSRRAGADNLDARGGRTIMGLQFFRLGAGL
jgi:amino acid efflux transporter